MDKKRPIVYITRDIERALGMEPKGDYYIVTNDAPQGQAAQKRYGDNVILINDPRGTLDTFDLLSLPHVAQAIDRLQANIVVFQNTPRIERLAIEREWRLVNPLAELAKRVEEKVSQVSWLNDDAMLLPPHAVTTVKDVTFEGQKFVLQFNHSHTGQGTFIIETAAALDEFKAKFPERECRVVEFVSGPVFTANAVVTETGCIVGSISYQITGLKPFTDLPFSTIGNDWSLPHAALSEDELGRIRHIARTVGERLKRDGWRGLFGIDVAQDALTREIFLLEINARQPASTTFESQLQARLGMSPTIFELHLAALTDQPADNENFRTIRDGAQVVQRVTEIPRTVDVTSLESRGFSVTRYENTEHNKELFRIQSEGGIMKEHNVLGEQGELIRSCIM